MIARISDWLYAVSRGRVALAALVIFLLFSALVLPAQSARSEGDTGSGPSPDTSLSYSPAQLYAMAESFGEAGRAAYIRARLTFDLVWPLVYVCFLATGISWLGARAFARDSSWRLLNLVPVLGFALDYLENVCTSLVMARYPLRTPVIDFLAPLASAAKWFFVGGSFVVLVAFAVVAVVRRARRVVA